MFVNNAVVRSILIRSSQIANFPFACNTHFRTRRRPNTTRTRRSPDTPCTRPPNTTRTRRPPNTSPTRHSPTCPTLNRHLSGRPLFLHHLVIPHRMPNACLPCQITHASQWYQQEPPEDTPPPASLFLIGRRRRLTIQGTGESIPVGTIRPQRISFGCPPEQIVHITIIVFHKQIQSFRRLRLFANELWLSINWILMSPS